MGVRVRARVTVRVTVMVSFGVRAKPLAKFRFRELIFKEQTLKSYF